MTIRLAAVEVPVVPDLRGLHEKIAADVRTIPNAKIGADVGEAATKIAALQSQVDQIGRHRLEVRLDTAQANAQLARLRAQAAEIRAGIKDRDNSGLSPETVGINTQIAQAKLAALDAQIKAISDRKAQVQIDTAAANLKVAGIKAEIDSIRDKHVNVDVDDHGSAAKMASGLDVVPLKVAAIGAALIALIPIAAAASAAIAGIGVGVGLGIAGAGIGVLTLGPVFKALSAQKSAGGGGGTTSEASALNTQRQAEVALTVAQRNAVQAQKDLTKARLDATQALQDLSDKVIDNGLAQRQAVLDLAKARQDLDVANANPDVANKANANALAQVQLTFDSAKQRLAELQGQGALLQSQRAAANAAGIDGADNVVQAQNRVVDSQNALVEAQYQVAHATDAASGSTSAYQQALDKLNPAQKQFLAFLQSVKGQFSQLSDAASTGFLPKLQEAITILLPVLPAAAGFLGHLASAFGDLAVNAAKGLTGPFWSQFFAFLDRITDPAVGLFGSILGDLFRILAGSFQALWPAIFATGQGLDGFLKHIANSIQGGALDGFVKYVKDNLPRVEAFFDSLWRAIGRVVSALAPLGAGLLDGLTKALDGISKLPPGVLQGGAIGLGAAAIGGKAIAAGSGAVTGIAKVAGAGEAAGPIGLGVSVGLVAAAAGFTALYIKSKTFHDFVNDKLYPVLKRIAEDALEGIRKGIAFVSDAVGRNKGELKELADFIVEKVLPVLGPILQGVFEAIGFSLGLTINLIGLLVDAFTAVVGATKTAYSSVKGFVSDVVDAITAIPGKLLGFGQDFLDAGSKLMGKIFDGLASAAAATGTFATKIAKGIVNSIIDLLNDVIPHDFGVHINEGPFHFNETVPLFPTISRLAQGGLVGGPGTGTSDSIPAWLSNGEFVVNAAATRQNLDALTAMNSGHAGGSGRQVTQYFQLPMTDPVAIAAATNRRLTRV